MTQSAAERLYALVPAVYRVRDAAQGEPLRALVEVLAREFAVLEESLEQLHDDQFIETCAGWVAPYIGDLVGYRPLHGVAPGVSSPRAEVANTIRYRRRKGTALMLEQLASDVTGWPARAVEYFERLATTQSMRHVRAQAFATASLRDSAAPPGPGGAFDAVAHLAEVRSPERGGRYNLPNIGLFVWRLLPMRLRAVPLTPDPGDPGGRRFRVNPLGADLALFRRPVTESDISHLAEPVNVPAPLQVRQLATALERDYGNDRSLCLMRPGDPPTPVPAAQVRACDLRDLVDAGGNVTGWNHEQDLPAGVIGIDPERGRVLLGSASDGPLLATFHHGAASAIGGGEYERIPAGSGAIGTLVTGGSGLQAALDANAAGGYVSIGDSMVYSGTPSFRVDAAADPGAPGCEVVVSATNGARPVLSAGGRVSLAIGARGRLVLDGLVLTGGALHLEAAPDDEPRELVLRDCTLVPGISLLPDGSAAMPGAPSLVVEHPFASLTLERCICGPLQIVAGAQVVLRECVVDAGAPDAVAFDGDGAGGAGASLEALACTVIGKVHAHRIDLASNCLFFARLAPGDTWPAPLLADRRQAGCIRFSHVPRGSITPRRHRCTPDASRPGIEPHFTSTRYGDAGYIQLDSATDLAIRRGADDEGEPGVLHALYQPQRETNLRVRLEEYLRFGLQAGIFHST